MQGAGAKMIRISEQKMPLSNAWGPKRARLMRSCALIVSISLCFQFSACKKLSDVTASIGDVTGSTGSAAVEVPTDQLGQQRFVSEWASRYERQQDDKKTAMNYALGLRAVHRHDQAIAVLQRLAIKSPNDLEILASYGKALADAGKFQEAAQVLERAQVPEKPNWSIMSTQGSIADQTGNHTLAQQYYNEALKVAPGEPSVLSNLGLSYALSRQLTEGERVLRQASDHPRANTRVRQNLALVLALQGKFAEAEDVLRKVLTPADATANVASIRSMIAQSNTWREIQGLDGQPRKPARAKKTAAAKGQRG